MFEPDRIRSRTVDDDAIVQPVTAVTAAVTVDTAEPIDILSPRVNPSQTGYVSECDSGHNVDVNYVDTSAHDTSGNEASDHEHEIPVHDNSGHETSGHVAFAIDLSRIDDVPPHSDSIPNVDDDVCVSTPRAIRQ